MRWPAGDLSRDWFLSTEVNRAPESLRSCPRGRSLAGRDSPFLNSSYTTTADIEVHEGGTEGTIPTPGDRFAELRLLSAEGQPSVFGVISTSSASNGKPRMRSRGEHRLEFELKSDGHSITRRRSTTSAAFAAPPQERSPIIDHLKIFEDELGSSNRTLIPGLSPSMRCVGTARSLKILRPISEWFLVAPFAK